MNKKEKDYIRGKIGTTLAKQTLYKNAVEKTLVKEFKIYKDSQNFYDEYHSIGATRMAVKVMQIDCIPLKKQQELITWPGLLRGLQSDYFAFSVMLIHAPQP